MVNVMLCKFHLKKKKRDAFHTSSFLQSNNINVGTGVIYDLRMENTSEEGREGKGMTQL